MMFSTDNQIMAMAKSRMLLFGKMLLVSGLCLLLLAGLGASGLAPGVVGATLVWSAIAGAAGLVAGAVLIGFGVLEERLSAQQGLLLEMQRQAEAAPPAPSLEEPRAFRSRPAAAAPRRLRLI